MSYTTVEIYCDEASHQKPWVWTFARMGPADWMPTNQVVAEDDGLKRLKDTHARVDEATGAYLDAGFSGPVTVRDRDRLECEVCGLAVRIRRKKLNQILEILHQHGESKIRLSELAARLRRSKTR